MPWITFLGWKLIGWIYWARDSPKRVKISGDFSVIIFNALFYKLPPKLNFRRHLAPDRLYAYASIIITTEALVNKENKEVFWICRLCPGDLQKIYSRALTSVLDRNYIAKKK